MKLARIDEGRGDLVLLLHSGGMSSRQWRRLVTTLAARYRVVAPDLLGSGQNPRLPADAPFAYPDDVAAVLELLAEVPGAAHVVGHSYGGFLALKLALAAPSRIRSLSLFDPVAFGALHGAADEEGLRDLARAAEDPVFLDEVAGGGEPWFRAFVDYWNGAGAWDAMSAQARGAFLEVGRKVFLEVASLMRDMTPASAYSVLDVPALFLTGERSPLAARRVAALVSQAMPRGKLQTLPGTGHMGPITAADAVNALIVAHIDAVAT